MLGRIEKKSNNPVSILIKNSKIYFLNLLVHQMEGGKTRNRPRAGFLII